MVLPPRPPIASSPALFFTSLIPSFFSFFFCVILENWLWVCRRRRIDAGRRRRPLLCFFALSRWWALSTRMSLGDGLRVDHLFVLSFRRSSHRWAMRANAARNSRHLALWEMKKLMCGWCHDVEDEMICTQLCSVEIGRNRNRSMSKSRKPDKRSNSECCCCRRKKSGRWMRDGRGIKKCCVWWSDREFGRSTTGRSLTLTMALYCVRCRAFFSSPFPFRLLLLLLLLRC